MQALSQPMKIIDAHVHFVDLERPEGVVWPSMDSPHYGNFMPCDLLAEAGDIELAGCVLVETSSRPSDNEWMLQLYEQEPLVLGVVANLDPILKHFNDRLQRLAPRPGFKGLRLRPIEHYDLRSEALVYALSQLGSYKKTIELGATTTERLKQYASLARSAPTTTCILDHMGHPRIDGGKPDAAWLEAMEEFAANENACCKVSGLMSLAQGHTQSHELDFYRPTLDLLLHAFGQDRLLFGSNWPPARTAGSYRQAVNLLEEFYSLQGATVRDKFFSANARRIYQL
jgi:predicted TIM-barrel fold metal-dependent hydrolase